MLTVILVIRALIIAVVAVLRWAALHWLADIPLGTAGYALFVFLKPYRQCRWCRPGSLLGGSVLATLARHKPRPRKPRRCWRCKGHRLTRRLGAYHVHKVRQSLGLAFEEWRSK